MKHKEVRGLLRDQGRQALDLLVLNGTVVFLLLLAEPQAGTMTLHQWAEDWIGWMMGHLIGVVEVKANLQAHQGHHHPLEVFRDGRICPRQTTCNLALEAHQVRRVLECRQEKIHGDNLIRLALTETQLGQMQLEVRLL